MFKWVTFLLVGFSYFFYLKFFRVFFFYYFLYKHLNFLQKTVFLKRGVAHGTSPKSSAPGSE